MTWQQGDPRRPYPTDIEMRLGFLGRPETMQLKTGANGPNQNFGPQGNASNTTPVSSPMLSGVHQATSSPSKNQNVGSQPPHIPPGASGHFSWGRDGEMSMSMPEGGSIPIEISGAATNVQGSNQQASGGKGVRIGHGGHDDVDVMSTDSSSSSSTDSN